MINRQTVHNLNIEKLYSNCFCTNIYITNEQLLRIF